MMLAGIMTFPSVLVADDNTPEEEKVIILTGQNNNASDEATHQVPVTATLSNGVLNIQFVRTIPKATISVSNNLTGAVTSQTLNANFGTICTIPVAGISMGTLYVTDKTSGESVSGEFETEE